MLHTKTKDWRRVITADLLLLGIETDALGNVAITMKTEDTERHFKTNGLGTSVETRWLLFVQLVARDDTFMFWRDITSDISLVGLK